jgi:hypothetical protein
MKMLRLRHMNESGVGGLRCHESVKGTSLINDQSRTRIAGFLIMRHRSHTMFRGRCRKASGCTRGRISRLRSRRNSGIINVLMVGLAAGRSERRRLCSEWQTLIRGDRCLCLGAIVGELRIIAFVATTTNPTYCSTVQSVCPSRSLHVHYSTPILTLQERLI